MDKKNEKQLAESLYSWRNAYTAMEKDPAVEKARMLLVRAEKRLEKATRAYEGEMKGAKMVIESILPDIGKSVIAFGIRAKFTAPYLRITYDRKTLDRIAEENTRLRNLIFPHRKETPVKGRVNLEVAHPESLLKSVKFVPAVEVQ